MTKETLRLLVAGSVSSWFAVNYTKQMCNPEGYRKRDRELYAMQTVQRAFQAKDRTTTSTTEATATPEKSI